MTPRITTIVAILTCLALTYQAGADVYTFDSLSSGDLAGQDNWKQFGSSGTDIQVTTPTGVDTSTEAASIAGSVTQDSRINDSNFSYPSPDGTTKIILQFDTMVTSGDASHAMSFFGVGSHSPSTTAMGLTDVAVAFGVQGTDGYRLFNYTSVGGGMNTYGTTPYTLGDWVRIQLDIDPTANSGNGSASMFVEDLTAGDVSFTPVAGLQNIDLEWITDSLPLPTTWNGMWIDLRSPSGDAPTSADNLSVTEAPEPSMAGLLIAGGGLLLGRRGRARKTQTYASHIDRKDLR